MKTLLLNKGMLLGNKLGNKGMLLRDKGMLLLAFVVVAEVLAAGRQLVMHQ